MIRNIIIPNVNDKKHSFEVIVQSNKNLGICDIILPNQPVCPERPQDTTNGLLVRAYNDSMTGYRKKIQDYKATRSSLLNIFYGRQINSKETFIHLSNVLYETLNDTNL